MGNLGVGQLARRAGVAIDTVRYYERNQLVTPAGQLVACQGHGRAEACPILNAALTEEDPR